MNPNDYLDRVYPSPPCWALVADVYRTERAQPVGTFRTVNASVRAVASAFRLAIHKDAHGFAQIAEPVDYCVVLLGRTERLGPHHCGVWYQGKILHALDSGVYYEDMPAIADQYALIEFWAPAA